jgi:hypothetical protein
MRTALSLLALLPLLACSTNKGFIGPEPDASAKDGGQVDGSVPPDGGNPDGGNTTSAPGWVSGTRLRARVYVSSDGAKQFAGWYDSQRKENCTIYPAADGVLRCLPYFAPTGQITDTYFSDAQCTVPLALVTKGCSPKYEIRTEVVSACAQQSRYHVLTPGVLANPSTYYVKSANQCIAQTYNSNLPDFWTVGSEIPASSFADATEQTE